ncbi:MAG: type VI secretion system tube protein Hcp [Opitutaceae bacterium]
MKSPKYVLATLLATSLLSVSFGGGYLKLGDIKGESTDSAHKDWIEVLSVSGLSEDSTRDHSSGMATGKRQHKPITITHEIDKSTPKLATGASFGSSVSISSNGKLYQIEGARIASVTREGTIETITLTCTSITAVQEGQHIPSAQLPAAAPATKSAPAPKAAPAQDYNSSRSNS